jgi:hypothetical protein
MAVPVGMMDPRQQIPQSFLTPTPPPAQMPGYNPMFQGFDPQSIPPEFFLPGVQPQFNQMPFAPLAPMVQGTHNGMPAIPGLGGAGGGGGGPSAGAGQAAPNQKIGGALSGAAMGMEVGGPWGALIGGVAGYALNGGAKDLNPIDASGFSGISMDKARENGNLARLGSNPAAALASYLGVQSDSTFGKLLDPAGAFKKDNKEEGVRDQYYSQLASGNFNADPKTFTTGLVGEFRGSRSTFPARASGMYGPKDDDKYAADFANQINQAYQSGAINANDDAVSIYAKVINPWLSSMGPGWSSKIAPEDLAKQQMMTVDMIQRYVGGSPITWQDAHGGKADFAIPQYLGRAQPSPANAPVPQYIPRTGLASPRLY